MSTTCDYRSQALLGLDEIEKVVTHCEAAVDDFSIADSLDMTFEIKPSKLPFFDTSRHGQLEGLYLIGLLNTKDNPYPAFKDVLLAAQNNKLGEYANVRVRIGYEDRSCKQTRGNHNSIGLFLRDNKVLLDFSDRTALTIKEDGQLCRVYERLIDAGNLPLEIQDQGESLKRRGWPRNPYADFGDFDDSTFDCNHGKRKYFTLKHREGGYLSFNVCLQTPEENTNPRCILCELPKESLDAALTRIETILDAVASEKRFSFSWTVSNCQGPKEPLVSGKSHSTELYENVTELNLPAKKYDFLAELKCTSIEGFEFFQQLCGPKDYALVPIFACQHPHDPEESIEASIRIESAGYRLITECSDFIETHELSKFLGVEMEDE